jgi:hypothetical protein
MNSLEEIREADTIPRKENDAILCNRCLKQTYKKSAAGVAALAHCSSPKIDTKKAPNTLVTIPKKTTNKPHSCCRNDEVADKVSRCSLGPGWLQQLSRRKQDTSTTHSSFTSKKYGLPISEGRAAMVGCSSLVRVFQFKIIESCDLAEIM